MTRFERTEKQHNNQRVVFYLCSTLVPIPKTRLELQNEWAPAAIFPFTNTVTGSIDRISSSGHVR